MTDYCILAILVLNKIALVSFLWYRGRLANQTKQVTVY